MPPHLGARAVNNICVRNTCVHRNQLRKEQIDIHLVVVLDNASTALGRPIHVSNQKLNDDASSGGVHAHAMGIN